MSHLVTLRQAGLACSVSILALLSLAGCDSLGPPKLDPLPQSAADLAATARVNGAVGRPAYEPPPQVVIGPQQPARTAFTSSGPGIFMLDFADTDVREAVAQILGSMLGVSYTIDPSVHGTVTLHTAKPLARDQLLGTLQALLAGNGAALVSAGGIMRVVPAGAAGTTGSRVIQLRYVSAEELAKVLQPLAGNNAKVGADPSLNALVLSGDAGQLDMLQDLVRSFDLDALSGQSYALLPVPAGSARDFAEALQEALRGRSGGSLSGLVRVAPLQKLGAVLVFASQPRYIERAQQVFALVDRQRRATVRGWRVDYLQNSSAEDVAYTLQMAFTPNNVTAVPKSQQGSSRAGALQQSLGRSGAGSGGGGAGSAGSSGAGGGLGSGLGSGLSSGGGSSGGGSSGGGFVAGSQATSPGSTRLGGSGGATASANPLLGGLDPGGGSDNADTMRILPDPQNNALLIFGTSQETDTVEAMLRKIDILPMQVRIDATIAEVTLTDELKYGTQFFFKSGGLAGFLNNTASNLTDPVATITKSAFNGFAVAVKAGGAIAAIDALQAVTTVNVLSSPQLMVVDNQPARLQVGSLVPYLNATAQSTLSSNAPIVNQVSYQPTGVIMDVTPRVNSGGLVTLDITQEVSDVDTTTAKGSGIDSPTFQQRVVSSRVVVQDGQTIGIAGLIRDADSRSNAGVPWLKDIPVLGVVFGQQNNHRVRTELLVLLTPHVVRSQREAHDLTDELRDALRSAAAVPQVLKKLKPSGSDDPQAGVIRAVSDW